MTVSGLKELRRAALQWHCPTFYSFRIAFFNKCERNNADSLKKGLAPITTEQFDWHRTRPQYRNIDRRSGNASILCVCLSVSTKLAVTQRQNVQHARTCACSICARIIRSMPANQNIRTSSWSCQRYATPARCAFWASSKTWQNGRTEERKNGKIIGRAADTCLTENKT